MGVSHVIISVIIMEKILEKINANNFEPRDYGSRPTVKVVILNDNKEVVSFKRNHFLIGGGIENGESREEAISRECLEEIGAVIEIIQPLGKIVQYRDALKKRYEVYGFLAKLISFQGKPTTTQADEVGQEYHWTTLDESITYLENKIDELEKVSLEDRLTDNYQGGLYNAKTHLIFIKKAQEILGL